MGCANFGLPCFYWCVCFDFGLNPSAHTSLEESVELWESNAWALQTAALSVNEGSMRSLSQMRSEAVFSTNWSRLKLSCIGPKLQDTPSSLRALTYSSTVSPGSCDLCRNLYLSATTLTECVKCLVRRANVSPYISTAAPAGLHASESLRSSPNLFAPLASKKVSKSPCHWFHAV